MMLALRIFWAFAVLSFCVLGRIPFIVARLNGGRAQATYVILELLLVAYLILWILFGKWWIRHTIGCFKRERKP
jgi:hypothetical protein